MDEEPVELYDIRSFTSYDIQSLSGIGTTYYHHKLGGVLGLIAFLAVSVFGFVMFGGIYAPIFIGSIFVVFIAALATGFLDAVEKRDFGEIGLHTGYLIEYGKGKYKAYKKLCELVEFYNSSYNYLERENELENQMEKMYDYKNFIEVGFSMFKVFMETDGKFNEKFVKLTGLDIPSFTQKDLDDYIEKGLGNDMDGILKKLDDEGL